MKLKLINTIIVLCSFLASCTNPDFALSFQQAGGNKDELVKFYKAVKAEGNAEKLKAAEFILKNMAWNGHHRQWLSDTNGDTVLYTPMVASNTAEAMAIKEKAMNTYALQTDAFSDAGRLSADFLKDNLDKAYHTWKTTPWAKGYSLEVFCRYLLPYRMYSEPLSDWRNDLDSLITVYSGSLEGVTDPVVVADSVHQWLNEWLKYDVRWVFGGFGIRSAADVQTTKTGMCDDMSMLASLFLRGMGVATAIDHTLWGRSNYGHSWSVVFDHQAQAYGLEMGGRGPYEYNDKRLKTRTNLTAKVYRATYEAQPGRVELLQGHGTEVPPRLRSPRIIDVTGQYTQPFSYTSAVNSDVDVAYLCVYNNNRWQPVDYSLVKQDSVCFQRLGARIVYLPATYKSGEVIPLGDPFYIDVDQRVQTLGSDSEGTCNISVSINDVVEEFRSDSTVTVNVWDGNWSYYNTFPVVDKRIRLDNIHKFRLYWMANNRRRRIFTVEKNMVIWR